MSSQVKIHPLAIVDPAAELDHDVEIGPFCTVGPKVRLGRGVKLISHVTVDNRTTVGAGTVMYPFATVGVRPQDLKFHGEDSELIVGENNQIREYANISIGTENGGGKTLIGSQNLIMVYCHIAHDCIIGNKNIFANAAQLAGHVIIENRTMVGGMAGVHQFCRVGELSILAGGAKVAQDVPPYCLVQGDRARAQGINLIGLKRAGMTLEEITLIKTMYKIVYRENVSLDEALQRIRHEVKDCPQKATFEAFLEQSTRGICR